MTTKESFFRCAIFTLALATVTFPAQAETPPQALVACFDAAGTPERRYQCMGTAVDLCREGRENSEDSLVACLKQETAAWTILIDREAGRIEGILKAERITSGNCLGNDLGCLRGFGMLQDDGAAHMEQMCKVEAAPENNAGHPELAMAACRMRETARQTIRVYEFGAGMGDYTGE